MFVKEKLTSDGLFFGACAQCGGEGKEGALSLLIRSLILSQGPQTFDPHLTLITSQRPHLEIPLGWKLGIQLQIW